MDPISQGTVGAAFAQSATDKKNIGKIVIGNGNVFNEYTNIHLPTSIKRITHIGNNNYIMNSTTIDHDCF